MADGSHMTIKSLEGLVSELALSAGRDNVLIAPEATHLVVAGQAVRAGQAYVAGLAWPGFLRKPDRTLPGYAS